MLATLLLPVVASSLTDGIEGSRMRFSTTFLMTVGVCWLLSRVRPRAPARQLSPTSAQGRLER